MMKMLIGFQSVLNLGAKTDKGNTPLVLAICNGNLRACQLMLKKELRLPSVVSHGMGIYGS